MQDNKTHIDISIPYDLARYLVAQRKTVRRYDTNQLIKAFDTWLVLKHETTSGIIGNWNDQKQYLLSICKCSESIFRHRLKMLASMQLLQYDRKAISIVSWEKLGESLNIETDHRLTIKYPIDGKQRVQEWIIATEIEDNKQRQDFCIITKVKKNADLEMFVLAKAIDAGADRDRLQKDIDYFLMWMRILYQQSFLQASATHEVIKEVRPDNNRGVKGIATAWSAKHPQTVSYWKKIMQRNAIIDVSKLQIQSENRVRNRYCRVVWLFKEKQTLLCLCDQIDLLKPWTLQAAFSAAA